MRVTPVCDSVIVGRSFTERIEPRRRRELEWPPARAVYRPPAQSSAPAAVAAAVAGGGYIDAGVPAPRDPGSQQGWYRPLPPFRIPASGIAPGAVPPGKPPGRPKTNLRKERSNTV